MPQPDMNEVVTRVIYDGPTQRLHPDVLNKSVNKEALTIAHAQWLSQPETQSFIKNLQRLQSDLHVKASNLALNTCSEDTTLQIRALLVSAARTNEIILYATKNIESITRHG